MSWVIESKILMLIGYLSIGAYKPYSPIGGKLVSKKDFLVSKSKGWELESKDHIHYYFQRKGQNEASTGQDEEVFKLIKMKLRQAKMKEVMLRLV